MRTRNPFLLFIVFTLMISCEETEFYARDYPRLNTTGASDVTLHGATFNAEFDHRGEFEILEYGFVWSLGGGPTLFNGAESVILTGNPPGNKFSATVTTEFDPFYKRAFVRAFVKTEEYTVYGDVVIVSVGK